MHPLIIRLLTPHFLLYVSNVKTQIGTFTHKLQKYWSEILCEMETVLDKDLEMDPMSLIGHKWKYNYCSKSKMLYNLLTFAVNIYITNILLQWISDKSSSGVNFSTNQNRSVIL